MYSQFSLKPVSHLNEGMIWLVAKYFDSDNVPVKGEQIEKLILINFLILSQKIKDKGLIAIKNKLKEEMIFEKLTSGFRLETKMVHLSLVPLIPGGRPPPNAVAIAAAFPN